VVRRARAHKLAHRSTALDASAHRGSTRTRPHARSSSRSLGAASSYRHAPPRTATHRHCREGCGHRVEGGPPAASHRGHDGGRALELLVHLDGEDGQRRNGRGRLDLPARVTVAPARPAARERGHARGCVSARGERLAGASCRCSSARLDAPNGTVAALRERVEVLVDADGCPWRRGRKLRAPALRSRDLRVGERPAAPKCWSTDPGELGRRSLLPYRDGCGQCTRRRWCGARTRAEWPGTPHACGALRQQARKGGGAAHLLGRRRARARCSTQGECHPRRRCRARQEFPKRWPVRAYARCGSAGGGSNSMIREVPPERVTCTSPHSWFGDFFT
jgi:hypothetical protein